MRTSRISSNGATIYSNQKKVTTVGDFAFQSNMQQRPHQHLRDDRKKDKKDKLKKINLKTNKNVLIVKGIRFIGEDSAGIHNNLLVKSIKIQHQVKSKIRNIIYRTSI